MTLEEAGMVGKNDPMGVRASCAARPIAQSRSGNLSCRVGFETSRLLDCLCPLVSDDDRRLVVARRAAAVARED